MFPYLRTPTVTERNVSLNMAADKIPFADFFKNWADQHHIYLHTLLSHQDHDHDHDHDQNQLVRQVLRHYEDYYDEKSKAAESDVFLMFSPPWFSSYERTLLWVSGFKPSLAFRLVKESVGDDLNDEQLERIAVVRKQTRQSEKNIAEALASVQERVAASSCDMGNATEELKAALLAVMRDADGLRQRTGMEVLEVLSPGQKVKFLAVTSQFWLQSRRLGMERDRSFNKQTSFC